MMVIDLTVQLAPIFWAAVVLLAVSAMGIGLSGAWLRMAVGLRGRAFKIPAKRLDWQALYIRS